jgi:hypothetical protein
MANPKKPSKPSAIFSKNAKAIHQEIKKSGDVFETVAKIFDSLGYKAGSISKNPESEQSDSEKTQ